MTRTGKFSDLPSPVRGGTLSLLAVVLLASDVARGAILSMLDPSALFLRHHPIGLSLILHVVDVLLLVVQAIGLAFIQLSAGNALINPSLLIRLPLINSGCLRLRQGKCRDTHREHSRTPNHLLHTSSLGYRESPVVQLNVQGVYFFDNGFFISERVYGELRVATTAEACVRKHPAQAGQN